MTVTSLHPLMKLSWVQIHVTPWNFSTLLFWFNRTHIYDDQFFIHFHEAFLTQHKWTANQRRGIEWFPEKRTRKIFALHQNLGSVCGRSRSCVFRWFCILVSQIFFEAQSPILKLGSQSRKGSNLPFYTPQRDSTIIGWYDFHNSKAKVLIISCR